jgi:hypothetical protein
MAPETIIERTPRTMHPEVPRIVQPRGFGLDRADRALCRRVAVQEVSPRSSMLTW